MFQAKHPLRLWWTPHKRKCPPLAAEGKWFYDKKKDDADAESETEAQGAQTERTTAMIDVSKSSATGDDPMTDKHGTTTGAGIQADSTAERPISFQGDLYHLPAPLAPLITLSQWVLWRWEKPKDKWTKVPYQPNGFKAKNNDPKTWSSYDVVIAALATGKFDGIGFCLLGGNFAAFDIDHCRVPTTGKIDSWATGLVERTGSYSEITVSGTGLRIIGLGNGPKLHRKLPVHNGVSLEAYRRAERYIVITGNPLPESKNIINIDEQLDATIAELEAHARENKPGNAGDGGQHERQQYEEAQGDKLERIIRLGENGEFNGDRSDAVWFVVCEMLRRGAPDIVAMSTLLDKANRISDHTYAQSQPSVYAKKQITKAKEKIQPTAQSPALPIQTSAEFISNFVPPDYLIDGIIQRRFIYSMTGPTGEGKTSVALHLALLVAQGWSLDGREIDKGKVLFLAGENPDDARMRWIKQLDDMELDPKDVDVFFVPGSFALSDKVMRDRIMKANEDHGPFDLIVVDTSAAFFEGEDENVNTQMMTHAKKLRGLIDLISGNPTVIVTSHPVKHFNRENMLPRGGGAFLNEMDGNLTCMKVDGTMVTELHWQGKFRGIDFAPISFRLTVGKTDKLKDSKGRLLWTVTAKTITAQERDAAEDAGQKSKEKLLAAMAKLPGASIADPAQEVRWLTKDGKPYRSLVQRLINALREDKLVKKESGRWVLTKKGKNEATGYEEEEDEELPF
jgi:hypothetical protein